MIRSVAAKAIAPRRGSRSPGPDQRDTGIRVLGRMPWGTHLCVFYETAEDLLDTAAAYFKAGLEGNEYCIWAISAPTTVSQARKRLREAIPNFDKHHAQGRIELLPGREWYLPDDRFELKRITAGWEAKLDDALKAGYDGLRISGNAFWSETNQWKEFIEYEHELYHSMSDRKMIALCTYSLRESRAVDILDVARAHQMSIARRNGDWDFLETPELMLARLEIARLSGALDILSKPFPGHEQITSRERTILSQVVKGASNKEAARALGLSPRTVEFHRANIMKKFDAKNSADLIRKVSNHPGHTKSASR